MIQSRLTSKAQTTLPRAVRIALGLREGDSIAYEIQEGRVILTRSVAAHPLDDPFATFIEWADEADSAYDVLGER
jgi:antitoxin PrlF